MTQFLPPTENPQHTFNHLICQQPIMNSFRLHCFLSCLLFCASALMPNTIAAQCAAPTYKETRYVFPYRALLKLNLPSGATGAEVELVQQGQPFTDNANAFGNVSGLFFCYNLTPETVYEWRARANCNGGGVSDWSVTYTFTTPSPCPPAPMAPLDSIITITFPTTNHPNMGDSICGLYTATSDGTYVWGFRAPETNLYRFRVLSETGFLFVNLAKSTGFHPECKGVFKCIIGNINPGYKYDFTLMEGDSIYFGFSFFPVGSADGSRSFVIEVADCPAPTSTHVDQILASSARLTLSPSLPVDIEVVPETASFTGLATFTNIKDSLRLTGLTPGIGYKWQYRGNCQPYSYSDWLPGLSFETPAPCDSLPVIQCDSTYIFLFKPGIGYLDFGQYAKNGREIRLRYRPERSATIKATINRFIPGSNFRQVYLAWRDSALMDCYTDKWNDHNNYIHGLPSTDELVYGEVGHTYYLLLEHSSYDTFSISLNIQCPDLCPAPEFLTLLDTQQNQVSLHWRNNNLSEQFEIELLALSDTFTGVPTHLGMGDTLLISGLLTAEKYHWRVRNSCNGIPGTWSAVSNFRTLPDCSTINIVTCGQQIHVNTASGIDYLQTCSLQNADEKYFLFTAPYDGVYTIRVLFTGTELKNFAYALKPAEFDCGPYGWKCLGTIYKNEVLSTGYLESGKTYRLAVERPNGGSSEEYAQWFVLQCPVPCIVADNLTVTGLSSSQVTLGWSKKGNEAHWDIEVLPAGQAFSGIPNYTADTLALTITDLPPGIDYQWRVRNDCGAYGVTAWTATKYFTLPYSCQSIACGESKTIAFTVGTGYVDMNAACTGVKPVGQDVVFNFTVGAGNTSRYIIFPPGSHANQFEFFLRSPSLANCAFKDLAWFCQGNSNSDVIIPLNNLVPGVDYYLLVKKKTSTTKDTLNFIFDCNYSCAPLTNTWTEIPNPYNVIAHWDGDIGPWNYQVEVRDTSGMPLDQRILTANIFSRNVSSLIGPGLSQIYDWTVRRICLNGDTSAWSPPLRFRLPYDCYGSTEVGCYVPQTISADPADEYTMISACGGWDEGQFSLYQIKLSSSLPPATYQLHIIESNGVPFTYALNAGEQSNCKVEPRPWPSCQTISDPGYYPLGTLIGGRTYYLQVAHNDALAGSQTFELTCACEKPTYGIGFIYTDGSAELSWQNFPDLDHWEIEIIPRDSTFSGIPTHVSTIPSLSLNGFDYASKYKFRIRTLCNSGAESAWSNVFLLHAKYDCAHPAVLSCGETVEMYVEAGTGSYNYAPCGAATPGKEIYMTLDAPISGDYYFTTTRKSGVSTINIGMLPMCGDTSIPYNCLSTGSGDGNLAFLFSGNSYKFVADNKFLSSGLYDITLHCPGSLAPSNDQPEGYMPPPVYNANAPLIPIDADCLLFTNRKATTNANDPDPTLWPGNWYDGPEHSVWFKFEAPPGGTVRVTVEQDDNDPMDPQVALLRFDSVGFYGYRVIASGEDQGGSTPQNAMLNYSGLVPGLTYYVFVDGANGTEGTFCLSISTEPLLSSMVGVCETFTDSPPAFLDTEAWRNLYASNDLHVNGPLLAAIKTAENLGTITISSEILPDPPVLPSGQKILPRYFNINPENTPQAPVKVRLFFTAEDLADFNLTPPVTNVVPFDLSISHYDGNDEDCDPANNVFVGGSIPVQSASAVLVGENGLFYLETTVTSFSEFGATIKTTGTIAPRDPSITVRVFPNPAVESVDILLGIKEPGMVELSFTNMTGQVMWAESWQVDIPGLQRTVSIQDFPVGMYQLLVKQAGYGLRRILVVKI